MDTLKHNETIKNELINFYEKSEPKMMMNEERDGTGDDDDTVDAENVDGTKTNVETPAENGSNCRMGGLLIDNLPIALWLIIVDFVLPYQNEPELQLLVDQIMIQRQNHFVLLATPLTIIPKCTFIGYLSKAKNDWSNEKYQHYIDQPVTDIGRTSSKLDFNSPVAPPRWQAIPTRSNIPTHVTVNTHAATTTSSISNISAINSNNNNNNNICDNDNKTNNIDTVDTIDTSNINNANMNNTINVSNVNVIAPQRVNIPRFRITRDQLRRARMDTDLLLLRFDIKTILFGINFSMCSCNIYYCEFSIYFSSCC